MITTDSKNYEVLQDAARQIKSVDGLTCEIGVRTGGGTKVIIDALLENKDENRTHICIDPYGHIPYVHHEDRMTRLDYTNRMRDQCFIDLYQYVLEKPVNLVFFNMDDDEFFRRFPDGVPIYEEEKRIASKYALVHLDGPHSAQAVIAEFIFFNPRMDPGGVIVCDDVGDYDHATVDRFIRDSGWRTLRLTERKQSYIKT